MKDFKKVFKELARAKQATAADHLELFVLKAVAAKSNHSKVQIASDMIREAFRPVTNKTKLENGMDPHLGLLKAFHEAWVFPISWEEFQTKEFATRPLLGCIENEMELWQYRHICEEIRNTIRSSGELVDKDYSFFFVRDDIDASYQAVQAAHAALLLGKYLTPKNINLTTLNFVVCGASAEQIETFIPQRIANMERVGFVSFKEPDIGDKVTCIATTPIPYSQKHIFGDFKLLKFDSPKNNFGESRIGPVKGDI